MKTVIQIMLVSFVFSSMLYTNAAEVEQDKTESESSAVELNDNQAQAASESVPVETTTNQNWGILGMNVRGNKESPMSLNIVPWRSANHQQLDPEVRQGWQPELKLLQPQAYRREIRAFLTGRNQNAKNQ